MTKQSSLKRSLFASVLSLVLCFSMLVGSTFAWFTDSVSSDTNTIVAGNLDIDLEYKKVVNGVATDWAPVEGESEIFDPDALWEPGRIEVVYLKVSNLGTLALKYQLGVGFSNDVPATNVLGNTFYLSDHLVFKVVEMDDALATYDTYDAAVAAAGTEKGIKDYNGVTKALDAKDGANDEDYVALIVYMPKEVGNEANYRGTAPSIDLGIKLYATQYTAESDSYGPDYDADAWVDGFKVTTAQDLQSAIENGEQNLVIMNDIVVDEPIVIPAAQTTYAMRSAPKATVLDLNGRTITSSMAGEMAVIVVEGYAVIKNGSVVTSDLTGGILARGAGANLLLENVTVDANGTSDSNNEWNASALQVSNGATMTVNSGNYSSEAGSGLIVKTSGGTVTINGGTFSTDVPNTGAALRVDSGWSSTVLAYVTVNGGVFNAPNGLAFRADGQKNTGVEILGGVFNGEIETTFSPITIAGGTFNQTIFQDGGHMNHYNITGGKFVDDLTASGISQNCKVAEGYQVVKRNGVCIVYEGDVLLESDANLVEVIANANDGDIILLNEGTYNLSQQIQIDNKSLTIIGLGEVNLVNNHGNIHMIQIRNAYENGVANSEKAKDDIVVTLKNITIGGANKTAIMVRNDIDLNLEDVTITGTYRWSPLMIENAYDDECAGKVANIVAKGVVCPEICLQAAAGHTTNFTYDAACEFKLVKTESAGSFSINGEACETDYKISWVKNDAELLDAIKLEGVKLIILAEGTYSADYKITVADLGAATGDVTIMAEEGAIVVLSGTTTLGYRAQGVGAAEFQANLVYKNIIFDHAENGKHSLDVQDIKSLRLEKCTIIGDGEYGITSANGNATGESAIVDCKFINAGIQGKGNFCTGLVIDGCSFKESKINIQGGNGVTVQNCDFKATIAAENVNDSFYLIRSNSTPITVKNCTIAVDSELTEAVAGQIQWVLLWNRGTTNWTVDGVRVTLSDAAALQTGLEITACKDKNGNPVSGLINLAGDGLTVNGVAQ